MNKIFHLHTITLFLLYSLQSNAQSPATNVVVHTLEKTAVTEELYLSGNLQSLRDSQLSVSVAALVEGIHTDVGQRVSEGQVLVSLDSTIAQGEYTRTQAILEAAIAKQAEAQRLLNEARQLLKKNHIGENEVKILENTERVSTAELTQARSEYSIAAEQLARHQLTAPFSGVVSQRQTEVGQWLSPGDPVLRLVSLEDVRLDVQLPQEFVHLTSDISKVHIQPDTQKDINVPANAETLVPVGDSSRSFLLRIAPSEPTESLLPGSSATAHIVFKASKQAILLPRDALLRNIDDSYSVFVIEDNKAKRRTITIDGGHQSNYWVQAGLKSGERVVVRGNEILDDDQEVNIVDNQAFNR